MDRGSLILMYTSKFPQAVLYSIAMGFFAHLVGTCIQHDGNHGAFSKIPLINTLAVSDHASDSSFLIFSNLISYLYLTTGLDNGYDWS